MVRFANFESSEIYCFERTEVQQKNTKSWRKVPPNKNSLRYRWNIEDEYKQKFNFCPGWVSCSKVVSTHLEGGKTKKTEKKEHKIKLNAKKGRFAVTV